MGLGGPLGIRGGLWGSGGENGNLRSGLSREGLRWDSRPTGCTERMRKTWPEHQCRTREAAGRARAAEGPGRLGSQSRAVVSGFLRPHGL